LVLATRKRLTHEIEKKKMVVFLCAVRLSGDAGSLDRHAVARWVHVVFTFVFFGRGRGAERQGWCARVTVKKK